MPPVDLTAPLLHPPASRSDETSLASAGLDGAALRLNREAADEFLADG